MPSSDASDLERNYLVDLGSTLSQCAENLVCLALQDAQRMASSSSLSPSTSKAEVFKEMAYFIEAMAPVPDHTEMETKVLLSMLNLPFALMF